MVVWPVQVESAQGRPSGFIIALECHGRAPNTFLHSFKRTADTDREAKRPRRCNQNRIESDLKQMTMEGWGKKERERPRKRQTPNYEKQADGSQSGGGWVDGGNR